MNTATSTSIQRNHLDILKLGVSDWNKWRVERTNIAPDLRGASLHDAHLAGADLRAVNLKGADLQGCNLRGANLKAADLRAANLKNAVLWSASLTGADLRDADLTGADLRGVNFRAANLGNAVLINVSTNDYTDFRHATVTGARLWEDGEPVADDLEAEVTEAAVKFTNKVLVKVEFKDTLPATDCAAVLTLLDEGFFEYERSFIESLREIVGGTLADACLHRLSRERSQIVLLLGFDIKSFSIDAVTAPLGYLILGRAAFSDIEDIWKRITIGGAAKKALVKRTGRVADDLQKTLRKAMACREDLGRFDLFVKAIAAVSPDIREVRIALALRHAK